MLKSLSHIFISAWNDSGGGYTHRLFDGHSQIHCWPFEIQLGTEEVSDGFSDWFHKKYRWPVFTSAIDSYSSEELFDAFIDDETKGNLIYKGQDKFKNFPLDIQLKDWKDRFKSKISCLASFERADVINAYLSSFFEIWKGAGEDLILKYPIVGHCPDLILDADEIFSDFPMAKIVHVYRNPYAGFHDLRYRRPEITLDGYCKKWNLINYLAFYYASKYPDRVKLLNFNELIASQGKEIDAIMDWLGLAKEDSIYYPSWNGTKIQEIQPFGGVQSTDPSYDEKVKESLTEEEFTRISSLTMGTQFLLNSL